MKCRLMLMVAMVAALAGVELRADQRPNPFNQAPEQVTVAAEGPLRLTIPAWIEPPPKRLGVFTVAQPEQPGELFRVSVPVGELTMRAVRAIGQARYRRAERKAREQVERELKDFQASQK